MTSRRISDIQRKTLKILYWLNVREGINHLPVPTTALFKMVAKNTQHTIAASNYRTSCHTLVERGILNQYRNPKTARLAVDLTPYGTQLAKEICDKDGD
ncbi:chromosome segregation protein ParM [Xenorhabdus sp. XENO-10]|uniref:Chromosome segregation protein ParM n=1 Tax=Xenorhabdus yunnanensis TaxID=3025878 RepID=A0ABT5LI86_9GAMM|nr:chromosome segregation protein ParM [Xenorhabdus yunnanensis]MDC9590720.1 chromosome segregation protein ParM [Xenorhabdus yunnanensis]